MRDGCAGSTSGEPWILGEAKERARRIKEEAQRIKDEALAKLKEVWAMFNYDDWKTETFDLCTSLNSIFGCIWGHSRKVRRLHTLILQGSAFLEHGRYEEAAKEEMTRFQNWAEDIYLRNI